MNQSTNHSPKKHALKPCSKYLKLVFHTWENSELKANTLYGLLDYRDKKIKQNEVVAKPISQVFAQIGNDIKAFDTIPEALDMKNLLIEQGDVGDVQFNFLFCILLRRNGLNIYSFNQLLVILKYLDSIKSLQESHPELYKLFGECKDIENLKEILELVEVENSSKDLWRVTKSVNWNRSCRDDHIRSRGLKIKQGDIIKLGRLKMKLVDIQTTKDMLKSKNQCSKLDSFKSLEEEIIVERDHISLRIEDEQDTLIPCRFCLSSESKPHDPLMNLCNCKGTQGFLHTECLRSWMEAQMTHEILNENSELYNWSSTSCELCKAPYPTSIEFNGKTKSILNYEKPDEPYFVFEKFAPEVSSEITKKSFYIFRIKNLQEYKIGKSSECEYILDDASASRFHAVIAFEDPNCILLKDYKSRYGTQQLMTIPQTLDNKDSANNVFQIGRTWCKVEFKKKEAKSSINSVSFGLFCGIFSRRKKH
ncbi:unnamed protein product [Moneuplotes crassus]|uniref:Uncharacterized protein n=1 Tax=Euplotes crassus TaxID=5936 RepID=A0AAD1XD68_EUPCR|nr:unnamed protein product [Moneuplotes crassus]